MSLAFHDIQAQQGAIRKLAEAHGLSDVRVFGSVVRGEATADSDIDFLVHPLPGCSLLDLIGFEHAVSDLFGGAKVDVLSDRAIKDRLKPYILAEARPV